MKYRTKNGKKLVTLIPGDGIGPECVHSTTKIIEATGVAIEWEEHNAGESVFRKGVESGVPKDTIDSIMHTRVALKGPLETPVGFGEKSANVTLRKLFETFGNIRPARELPGITTPYSGRGIDLVVVRENVEDLYAGIEHMQTPGVAQCLKVISRKGCEKIVRLAFEFARSEGRKKVHCATKSNIMKLTEGLLKKTFEEIAPEYPDIESNHIIIDNCAHQLVKKPEQFDVIVTTNMNGDIISDLTSALIGGLGFAPSANLGNEVAIFEAVHGSAPKYAGKNVINPTAVLMSAVMMLRYLDEFDAAAMIEHAVLVTLEEGKVKTGDVVGYDKGTPTSVYTDEIIKNFGRKSEKWRVRDHKPIKMWNISSDLDFVKPKSRRIVGTDIFVETNLSPDQIGKSMEVLSQPTALKLKMVSNRGTKVYPPTGAITDCVDQYRCRFILKNPENSLSDPELLELLKIIITKHKWTHIEKLHEFDGALGFTKAQGED
ncbi:MAG: NADP-dependent isocitrate dehydrogenase [Bacteroidota bacterium]|nr:NADP-dependent isocitrate dehydrogenase [Bacteroidota bacterium]